MTADKMGVIVALCITAALQSAIIGARADEVCCSGRCYTYAGGPAYDHLPKPRCPDASWPTFDLYTRAANITPARVTKGSIPPPYQSDQRTIFIVHGFQSTGRTSWIIEMKDELLYAGDFNVITVDWAEGADYESSPDFYKKAASTTRVVGSLLADIAGHLVTSGGSGRDQMWCVGHSLGAHTCGEAGAVYRFGRVTGLDPAGPSFGKRGNIGLRRNSADFVDVVHTDHARVFCCGNNQPRGHVDFYPNGGRKQPGCRVKRGKVKSEWLGCSHMKATAYFTDSIRRCHFYTNIKCHDATKIDRNWQKSCVQSKEDILQEMGFNADDSNYQKEGLFYVETAGRCEGASVSGSGISSNHAAALLSVLLSFLNIIF